MSRTHLNYLKRLKRLRKRLDRFVMFFGWWCVHYECRPYGASQLCFGTRFYAFGTDCCTESERDYRGRAYGDYRRLKKGLTHTEWRVLYQAFALLALRPVLEQGHAADPEGLVRAALLRAGAGREVVDAHREGDDVPPVVLTELVGAVSGMTVDGDRVHVRTPSLPLEAIDLDLAHPRGDIEIRWDCEEGEVIVPELAKVVEP